MQWASNSTWVEPEIGNNIAICIRVIDLGTQKNEYQGKTTWKRQSMVIWELPEQKDGEEKPITISKFYTATLSEKSNLRHDLENWRGRPFTPEELGGFEVKNIIGKPCLLNLVRNDKGKVKIGAVSSILKGMPIPKPTHETYIYDLDAPDPKVWEMLSDGIKAIIERSRERTGEPESLQQGNITGDIAGIAPDDDGIPF